MKAKKIITALVLTSALILSACGGAQGAGGAQGDGEVAPTASANNPVELRFSWWGGDHRHQATLEAIDNFNAQHPYITVIGEPNGWDGQQERIATQLAANTEPDVMQVDIGWLTTMTPDGRGFFDMDQVAHLIDMSGWDADFLDQGRIHGYLNGIPVSRNAQLLMVNRTVWNEMGVSDEQMRNLTWDDMLEIAQKFPDGTWPISSTGLGGFWVVANLLTERTGLPMINQYDAEVNWTVEDFIWGLDFYQNLEDGGVFPTWRENLERGGNEIFDGIEAGYSSWTAVFEEQVRNLEEVGYELIIVELPTVGGEGVRNWHSRPNFFFNIGRNTDHPYEAAQFINFLLNEPDGVIPQENTRGVPANRAAFEILVEADMLSERAQTAFQMTVDSQGLAQPLFAASAIQELWEAIFEEWALGQLTTQEAAEQFVSRLNETLERILN